MQIHPVLASAIGVFATIVLAVPLAHANPRMCRQLERQARALRRIGPGASRAGLRGELNQAEQQVRSAGCSGLQSLLRGLGNPQCRTLRADVDRLKQQLMGYNVAGSPGHRLRSVEAEMRRYGCTDHSHHALQAREYQTLCVRKCDGYYFPISFATPKSLLKRDQAACQSFYPDGAAELYVRPSGSEVAATMLSLDGKDYAEQPFAFDYRSAYRPACVAMLQAGVEAAANKAREAAGLNMSAIDPIPVPQTSANNPKAIAGATNSSPRIAVADRGKSKIRVVGPPYLAATSADGSVAPVAANSPPKRVVPAKPGIITSWFNRISSLIAPAAQAGEGN